MFVFIFMLNWSLDTFHAFARQKQIYHFSFPSNQIFPWEIYKYKNPSRSTLWNILNVFLGLPTKNNIYNFLACTFFCPLPPNKNVTIFNSVSRSAFLKFSIKLYWSFWQDYKFSIFWYKKQYFTHNCHNLIANEYLTMKFISASTHFMHNKCLKFKTFECSNFRHLNCPKSK